MLFIELEPNMQSVNDRRADGWMDLRTQGIIETAKPSPPVLLAAVKSLQMTRMTRQRETKEKSDPSWCLSRLIGYNSNLQGM